MQVDPALVVEELLAGPDGRAPTDYKLWVFHGVCRVVEVACDRFDGLREVLFTPAWDVIVDLPTDLETAATIDRPATLTAMISIAERLGAATDFIRVDLYDVGGRVVFGELTNYPGGGSDVLTRKADERLGAYWNVPRRYRD